MTVSTDCFSPSPNFRTVNMLHIVACLLIGYHLAPKVLDLKMDTVLWSINFVSPLTAVLVPLFTFQELASCMSSACKINSQTSAQFRSLPLHLFLFMITVPYFTIAYMFVFFLNVFPFWMLVRFTLYNYTYVLVAVVEGNASCLCFVAERAFSEIRYRMTPLKHKRLTAETFASLKGLLEKYLEVANLVSKIDKTFSVQFLNIFLSFALRAIVYAAYFIYYSKDKAALTNQLIVLVIHGAYQIIRLVFLCYRYEKIKEEVSDTG